MRYYFVCQTCDKYKNQSGCKLSCSLKNSPPGNIPDLPDKCPWGIAPIINDAPEWKKVSKKIFQSTN